MAPWSNAENSDSILSLTQTNSQQSHGIGNHTLSRTKFEFDEVRDKVRDKGRYI